jgi:ferredoxin-thioredoxin reductase catalytic subunit
VKKKFWRCYVCNDIHWGFKPPEVCPTCRVKTAYVEITAREARTILGHEDAAGPDFSREDFRRAIEAFARDNEFRVNSDLERVETLLDGIFNNERNHGLKYCPCRLRTKEFEEDLKIVCPCNFPSHETYQGQDRGECWCGLFIKR